jgi:hypothetical protein
MLSAVTAETGALTAITALVDLMLFLVFPVCGFYPCEIVLKSSLEYDYVGLHNINANHDFY